MREKGMKLQHSFSFTLICKILGGVLMVMMICFMIITNFVSQMLVDKIEKNTLLSFERTENEITTLMDSAKNSILKLNNSVEVNDFLHASMTPPPTTEEIQMYVALKDKMTEVNREKFDLISITNSSGSKVLLTINEFLKLEDDIPKTTPRYWTGYESYEDVLYEQAPETNFIYFARSLRNINDHFKSMFIIKVGFAPDRLQNTFAHLQGDFNNILLLDHEGRQLAGTDNSGFGQQPPYAQQLMKDSTIFDYTIAGTHYKIIPYHIKGLNWTIINEVPSDDYMTDVNNLKKLLSAIFIICFLLISIICVLQILSIVRPFHDLHSTIKNLSRGHLGSRYVNQTPITELRDIGHDFNVMADNINELMETEKQLLEQKSTLKMQALLAQINPHFIHNTVNLVKWMAMIGGNDNIVSITNSLVKILAPTFKNKNLYWGITDEKEFLEEYLNILDIRFGADIMTQLTIEPETLTYHIPRFILQPLIENTITHGYTPGRCLEIDVHITTEDKHILIEVQDNGSGIANQQLDRIRNSIINLPLEQNPSKGIGILNIVERLQLFYDDLFTFTMNSVLDEGTTVSIAYPVTHLDEE